MLTLHSRGEWLKMRTSYIGGSDAACVIGQNPWKTNVQLWREKTGREKAPDISNKAVVRYGINAEPLLRELFKLDNPHLDVAYKEHNIWLNDDYPWAHASLDGWFVDNSTGETGVLEIKTTEIMNATQWLEWDDRIPDNYYCQVLHYLAITESDYAVLKAQIRKQTEEGWKITTRHYRIERNQAEIDYLMEQEKIFVDYIIRDEEPPLLLPEI